MPGGRAPFLSGWRPEVFAVNRQAFDHTVREIRYTLRFLAEIGCGGFDCSEKSLRTLAGWGRRRAAVAESLDAIRLDLGDCRRCRLATGRHSIVFGSGNPDADLMFVGEGPGSDEDRQGEPFVGAAGQLLTRIIQAIQLDRQQVYICNIVKCRPPENRNPLDDEIQTCLPFLRRQISAVRPRFICALGNVAARTLLGTTASISRTRGRFHDVNGVRVLPTYHPAYLLRNPEKKREVWEDMKLLMKALE